MEKIFITIVALYALFVGIYFLYLRAGKRRKKDIVGKGSSIHETGQIKTDIVGKSRFDLSASKPLTAKSKPLAATFWKSDKSDWKWAFICRKIELQISKYSSLQGFEKILK